MFPLVVLLISFIWFALYLLFTALAFWFLFNVRFPFMFFMAGPCKALASFFYVLHIIFLIFSIFLGIVWTVIFILKW